MLIQLFLGSLVNVRQARQSSGTVWHEKKRRESIIRMTRILISYFL